MRSVEQHHEHSNKNASNDFPVLTPTMSMETLPFTGPEFYKGLDARFGDFAGHVLISNHTFDEAWPT